MVLEKFEYYDGKEKKGILLHKVHPYSLGLMLRKKDRKILFTLNKKRNVAFTSFFCRKFYMIILDENKKVTDKIYFSRWIWRYNCYGKYFIEILGKLDESSSKYRKI